MQNGVALLDRPTYGINEVDRLLGLSIGTARRWIDGYQRASRTYPPVVRSEPTGEDLVTWGEFVETRLLAEYRSAGIPMVRLRPAVELLREELDTTYPLASIRPFLEVQGRELLLRVQLETSLEAPLRLVVIRNRQLVLAPGAQRYVSSAIYDSSGMVTRLRPDADVEQVLLDPLRRSGQPVVRAVPTAVLVEQFRAGEPVAAIAHTYELEESDVEAALRYELRTSIAA